MTKRKITKRRIILIVLGVLVGAVIGCFAALIIGSWLFYLPLGP